MKTKDICERSKKPSDPEITCHPRAHKPAPVPECAKPISGNASLYLSMFFSRE
jgi:hypothetical protein